MWFGSYLTDKVHSVNVEMQKLALVKSPTDKMNVILSSHRVVVGEFKESLGYLLVYELFTVINTAVLIMKYRCTE